ncbi:hypothetical protein AFLA_011763 [Aspergillus flavus NRRL3357]|nr:hypothetical protein AFLA_011763 [Aspergillus flavus NRRL3357]
MSEKHNSRTEDKYRNKVNDISQCFKLGSLGRYTPLEGFRGRYLGHQSAAEAQLKIQNKGLHLLVMEISHTLFVLSCLIFVQHAPWWQLSSLLEMQETSQSFSQAGFNLLDLSERGACQTERSEKAERQEIDCRRILAP